MGGKVKNYFKERITYNIDVYPNQSGSGAWTNVCDYPGYYITAVHAYREINVNDG